VGAVAVSATARVTVAGMPARSVRFHPGVSASKMAGAAALSDRELGRSAFFLLPFDPGKLCTDQRTVDGTFLNLCGAILVRLDGLAFGRRNSVDAWRSHMFDRRGPHDGRRFRSRYRQVDVVWIGVWNDGRSVGRELAGKDFLVECRRGFLLSPSRDLAPFVRMLCIARGASGLLDVLFYHRDNGMVGQPPLARTVVVQYVTETQPALLHSNPPK
jgi:hypothetical protein